MSRVFDRLKAQHPEKISAAFFEDGSGYWIELKPGWVVPGGEHAIVESTVTYAVKKFRSVRPCCCAECQSSGVDRESR